ncbi:MAG: Zn-ribbon domain-containing OB-fold protein [bacterium]
MGITQKTGSNKNLTSFPGQIPVNYLYTYGLAGEDFFRTLKDKGQLTATACPECGTVYLPARIFCEQCMVDLEKPVIAPSTGTVHTFAICHEAMDGAPLDEPETIAVINIDGTDGAIVHRIKGIDPCAVFIGLRVEMVLKPKNKREGSIFDIDHFKPTRK